MKKMMPSRKTFVFGIFMLASVYEVAFGIYQNHLPNWFLYTSCFAFFFNAAMFAWNCWSDGRRYGIANAVAQRLTLRRMQRMAEGNNNLTSQERDIIAELSEESEQPKLPAPQPETHVDLEAHPRRMRTDIL